MKVVVGLGNVGPKYKLNRHNVGFMVVDELAHSNNISFTQNTKLDAYTVSLTLDSQTILLVKPTTMMNNSASSIRKINNFYKLSVEDFLIVSDDVDLAVGELRVRDKGSDGGHQGLRSIINLTGSNITRLRIGIGDNREHNLPSEAYVLEDFTKAELPIIKDAITQAIKLIEQWYK